MLPSAVAPRMSQLKTRMSWWRTCQFVVDDEGLLNTETNTTSLTVNVAEAMDAIKANTRQIDKYICTYGPVAVVVDALPWQHFIAY